MKEKKIGPATKARVKPIHAIIHMVNSHGGIFRPGRDSQWIRYGGYVCSVFHTYKIQPYRTIGCSTANSVPSPCVPRALK